MAREIKTKLTLEGAAEFKRGMSDAASAIKVLNSEQKLADATFKATGDAQQYLADKADILRRKMEEQQKAVAAAQAAVNQLNAQGMAQNSREMQTWQTRLNNAQASLQSMQAEFNATQSELGQLSSEMDKADSKAGGLDGNLRNIGKTINYDVVIRELERITTALETVIRTAARAAKAVWDAEADAGKWADELMTNASVAGFDVETYQAMQYASRFVDTDVNTIVSARQRLLKQMESAMEPPKVTEKGGIKIEEYNDAWRAFAKLGVSIKDANGQMRDQNDVFFDTIDALGRVENLTERDAIAMELMSRGARELNPLIEAGSQAYQNYVDEGREVAVVSEKNVKALGELDDANQKLEATLDKTKYEVLAELAPVFTEVSKAMATAVEGFDKFMQTEEGQAALGRLKDALEGIVNAVTEQDFSGLIDGAAGAIKNLTDALSWIGDHGEAVKTAFLGIAGAIAALKIATIGLRVAELVNGLKGLLGNGNAGGGSIPTPTARDASPVKDFVPKPSTPSTPQTARDTSPVFRDSSPVKEVGGAGAALSFKEMLWAGLGPAVGIAAATATSMVLDKRNVEQTYGTANEVIERRNEIDTLSETTRMLKEAADVLASDDAKAQYDFLTRRAGDINRILGHDPVSDRPATYAEGFNGWKGIDVYPADLAKVIEELNSLAEKGAENINSTAVGTSDRVAQHAQEKIDELVKAREEMEEAGRAAIESAASSEGNSDIDSMHAAIEAIMQKYSQDMDDLQQESNQKIGEVFGQAAEKINAMQTQEAQAMEANLAQMKAQVEADWLGIQSSTEAGAQAAGEVYGPSMAASMDGSAPVAAAQAISDSVIAEIQRPAGEAQTDGANVSGGMAVGIYANSGAAISAARALANAVQATIRSALQIFSPSRVMAKLGGFAAEGFAEGMEDETWRIERASSRMSAAATAQPVRAGRSGARGGASAEGGGTVIRNVIMVDGRVLGESMTPYISDEMASEIRVAR